MELRNNIFPTQTVWLAVVDVTCLVLAVIAGVLLRNLIGPLEVGLRGYILGHLDGWIYFCGSIILANYIVGSYDMKVTTSRFTLLVNWMFSLLVALVVLSITSYAWFELLVGRGVLSLSVAAYAFFTLFAKCTLYRVVFRSKLFVYHTAILGVGPQGRELQEMVEARHVVPKHKVSAYIRSVDIPGPDTRDNVTTINGVAVANGSVDALEDIVRSLDVDLLMVALENPADAARYHPSLRRVRFSGIEVMDALTASELYSGKVPLELVNDTWLMQASAQPSIAVVRRFKRMFDIVVGSIGCVIFAPVALFVAVLIKLSTPRSSVLYVQERIGRFGALFNIYKFRTMLDNTEETGEAVRLSKDDTRITRLGWILRKFRLDEIPQVVNILRGQMSLVGPRPERPELVAELEKKISFYRERENVLPGLTGWAQVQYPHTDNVEEAARKLEFDLYYIKNLSMRLDLQIILRTIRIIIFGKERSV